MAKWGEGDPRWIVEERADATNVNNWHWTEKNATGWSKDKLKSLLEGLKIQDDDYSCEIVEVEKIEGEASANNRKAKLIFFYEWDIKCEWKGRLSGEKTRYTGKLSIPNLSEENEPSDIDVIVTTESKADDAYKVKEFVRIKGSDLVREQLGKYIKELKQEFSKGMILPAGNEKKPAEPVSKNNQIKTKMNQPVKSKSEDLGVRINCKKLTAKENFKCRASELYRALTDQQMVCAFTRGEAEVEADKGGRFSLFGGNVCGQFTCLTRDKQLVMTWRFKTWPAEHYSTVTLDLTELDDTTDLELTQTGIPENEFERTKEGWSQYYWAPIKQTFGFGARLF